MDVHFWFMFINASNVKVRKAGCMISPLPRNSTCLLGPGAEKHGERAREVTVFGGLWG